MRSSTWTHSHRLGVALIVFMLAATAACTGGSNASAPATPTTTSTTAAVDEPPASDAAAPTPTAAPSSTTTPPPPDDADDSDLPTIQDLRDRSFEGEITEVEFAVSHFAALFDVEIDGAIPARPDETDPVDATEVIEQLLLLDDQLTSAQRTQINATLDAIRDTAGATVTNADLGGYTPGEVVEIGTAPVAAPDTTAPEFGEYTGFARPLPQITETELVEMVDRAQSFVIGKLGGIVPEFTISTIDAADRATSELNWAGWATTTEDEFGVRECDIYVVDFPSGSLDDPFEYGTVLHEYFHCWHGANFGGSVVQYWRSPGWVKEGLATWVTAEGGESDKATDRANTFLNARVGQLFRVSYSAVGFYLQINHLDGGPQRLWDRIPALASSGDHASAFDAATSGLSLEKLALLAPMSTQTGEADGLWEFNGPYLGDGARPVTNRSADPVAAEFARSGEQSIVDLEFTGDSSSPQIITIQHKGKNIVRWFGRDVTALFSDETSTWCLYGPCICEDGTTPVPDLIEVPEDDPRLRVALTGLATAGTSINTLTSTLDDACEVAIDNDVIGVWVADPTAVVEAFNEVYALIDVEVTGVSGTVTLELSSAGQLAINYRDLQLGLDDPNISEITFNGTGKMPWNLDGSTVVATGPSSFEFTVATPAFGLEPLTISDADGPNDGTLTFETAVDGNVLTVSDLFGSLAAVPEGQPNFIVFPKRWIRSTAETGDD